MYRVLCKAEYLGNEFSTSPYLFKSLQQRALIPDLKGKRPGNVVANFTTEAAETGPTVITRGRAKGFSLSANLSSLLKVSVLFSCYLLLGSCSQHRFKIKFAQKS